MRLRFIADRESVVLVNETTGSDSGFGLAETAPLRMVVERGRAPEATDLDAFGVVGMLDPEAFTQILARCLNAALSVDHSDIATASQALELLVAQQMAKLDAEDPVAIMEESLRYVLRQERWRFGLAREGRPDGVRIKIENPNGDPVPYGIHVSQRGTTPSFWVMQDNRLVQGSHAYKIPIQAATALKHAVEDFLNTSDIGTIRPFG